MSTIKILNNAPGKEPGKRQYILFNEAAEIQCTPIETTPERADRVAQKNEWEPISHVGAWHMLDYEQVSPDNFFFIVMFNDWKLCTD